MKKRSRRQGYCKGPLLRMSSAGEYVFRLHGLPSAAASILLILLLVACDKGGASEPPSSAPASPPKALEAGWNWSEFDHGVWNAALQRHVDNQGRVDYAAIGRDSDFDAYLHRLASTDADGLANRRQRLAFWINAYNALTIRAVLDTLPPDRSKWKDYRINDWKRRGLSIWQALEFDVGGGSYTLDQIEHEVLRKQDGLRDPRIHVALVCAARGCPPLWNQAYDPARIDEQLAAAMKRFADDPRRCVIDGRLRTITISKVFEWYASDFTDPRFTPHAETIPAFLGKYVSDTALAEALASGSWTIKYHEYDWRLNLKE